MADDMEARIRECERAVDRMDGRLARVEDDMKVFRPIPLENAEARGVVERMGKDMHDAFEAIRGLRTDLEAHRDDVLKVRHEREEKEREREKAERLREEDRKAMERRDRYARWIGAAALTLTFVSMTVGWLILAL